MWWTAEMLHRACSTFAGVREPLALQPVMTYPNLHTLAGLVQAAALILLACTSWMLPWLIPSVSVGFLLVAVAIYYYVSDQSETAILAFVCSCFVIFLVATADIVTARARPQREGRVFNQRS